MDERVGRTCIVGRWSLDDPTAVGRLRASDHSGWCQWGGVRSTLIHGVRCRCRTYRESDLCRRSGLPRNGPARLGSQLLRRMNSAYRVLFARRRLEVISLLLRRLFAIQSVYATT